MVNRNQFYRALKSNPKVFSVDRLVEHLSLCSQERIAEIASSFREYMNVTASNTIDRRDGLSDYRTSPYVVMACAALLDLSDSERFGQFLFDNKLYAGFETSFGKSIESLLFSPYPIDAATEFRWEEPREKIEEFALYSELSNEERARVRDASVWREVDKSCRLGGRRYLLSIKSGPNCINDTQVAAMVTAIARNRLAWWEATRRADPDVEGIDIVVGITYGTDKATNNKENQILVKLLEHGFSEVNREEEPGVLVDTTGRIRAYRRIGIDFWGFVGDPSGTSDADHVFLEVLLGLAKALADNPLRESFEERVTAKVRSLADALYRMTLPTDSLPDWFRDDFSEAEVAWLTPAMSAFYDQGF
jgi:Type II restriction endonuclease EcoO109I